MNKFSTLSWAKSLGKASLLVRRWSDYLVTALCVLPSEIGEALGGRELSTAHQNGIPSAPSKTHPEKVFWVALDILKAFVPSQGPFVETSRDLPKFRRKIKSKLFDSKIDTIRHIYASILDFFTFLAAHGCRKPLFG